MWSLVAATVPLARLLVQPKNPGGAIGLQQPEIAVALLWLAGRLRCAGSETGFRK
jgi:hypothetical protein